MEIVVGAGFCFITNNLLLIRPNVDRKLPFQFCGS